MRKQLLQDVDFYEKQYERFSDRLDGLYASKFRSNDEIRKFELIQEFLTDNINLINEVIESDDYNKMKERRLYAKRLKVAQENGYSSFEEFKQALRDYFKNSS